MVGRTDAPFQPEVPNGKVGHGRRERHGRARFGTVSSLSRALVVALALVTLAGCSGAAAPASFDPSQPCAGTDEQRMSGAYPDLEATIPAQLAGVVATTRESGRYCSPTTLGTLADTGIGELHYGAGTWDRGSGKAVSLVTLEAAGLGAQAVYESYLAGAQNDSKVHDITPTQPTLAGQPGYRIDFINGDSSFQRILVWPGDREGRVRVVLAADLLDVDIQAAVDAFH
jgi:hypothetical protein